MKKMEDYVRAIPDFPEPGIIPCSKQLFSQTLLFCTLQDLKYISIIMMKSDHKQH